VNSPQEIWQNQSAERNTMTLKLIEWKARELRAKTRKKLLGTLVCPLAIGLLYGFAAHRGMLAPFFICALIWSFAGLYFLNRGMRAATMPADAGLAGGLQFCLGELQRQRRLVQQSLLWSFGPLALAIGAFIYGLALTGRGFFPKALPFVALVVIWICLYFVIRWHEQRGLQNEIDELRQFEGGNAG
jgi:predicted lysophospholipase L1 biosynthesis ABC-type transport system permease subunit